MAISINDRQLITQFITNTQNLNVNLPTNGGGCANLVRGIIEQATGKRISVNPFGASLESMIQKINTCTAFKRRYIIRNEHDHIVISAGAVKGEPFLAGIKVRKL